MGHKTEYVTEGNDRFYQCSCGKQISTGHEADKHLLQAEIERLRDAIRDHRSSLEVWAQDLQGRWQLVREADGLLWSVLDEGGR